MPTGRTARRFPIRGKIADNDAAVDKRLADVGKTISSPVERDSLDKATADMAAYVKVRDELLGLYRPRPSRPPPPRSRSRRRRRSWPGRARSSPGSSPGSS